MKTRRGFDCSSWCSACGSSKKKNPDRSFHCFPIDLERCRLWVQKCKLHRLEGVSAERLNTYCKLCSNHFDETCFSGNRLKGDAVPNKNLPRAHTSILKRRLTSAKEGDAATKTSPYKPAEKRNSTPPKKDKRRRKILLLDDDDEEANDIVEISYSDTGEQEPKSGSTVPDSNASKGASTANNERTKLKSIKPKPGPTCEFASSVNEVIRNLTNANKANKAIRILRINNVPTEGNDISASSLAKIQSMLKSFSSEPNCKIGEIIKVVKGTSEDEPRPVVTYRYPPAPAKGPVITYSYPSTPATAANEETNFDHNAGPVKSYVRASTTVPNCNATNKNAVRNATVARRNILPKRAASLALVSVPQPSVEKVADVNEITMPKIDNPVLEHIQNKNVLATPGVNAKMSFEAISSLEDFHSDVPTILNVFSYPQEQWRTNNFERPKAVIRKPAVVKPPPVCCRGRCKKCQTRTAERATKVKKLQRSVRSYTRKFVRSLRQNEALKQENKNLREENRKLSETNLDLLSEPQRRLVDGMFKLSQYKSSNGCRYDPLLFNDCLTLRRISRAAYLFIKRKFELPIPSEHSLRNYRHRMNKMVASVMDAGPTSDGGGQIPMDVCIDDTHHNVFVEEGDTETVAAIEVIASECEGDGQMPLEVCIEEPNQSYVPLEVETIEIGSSSLGGQMFVISTDDKL